MKKTRQKRGKRGSRDQAQTTLAKLLKVIDAAADENQVNRIPLANASPGTRAILYSALLYTELAPISGEQSNRTCALQILREFVL